MYVSLYDIVLKSFVTMLGQCCVLASGDELKNKQDNKEKQLKINFIF